MDNNRDLTIDILRGLAMVLVVIGHSGFPYTNIIYLFHMPVFFMISGYLYNKVPMTRMSLKNRLLKRLIRLYVPYMAITVLFVILNNFFIDFHLYATESSIAELGIPNCNTPAHYMGVSETLIQIAKAALFVGGTQMGGALWFLRVMFLSSVIYEIENYIFCHKKNRWYVLAANTLLFVISALLNRYDIHLYQFESVLAVVIFYDLGRTIKLLIDSYGNYLNNTIISCLVCVTSVFVLFWISTFEDVNIGLNQYNCFITLLLSSIIGFIFLYSLAKLIKVIKLSKLLSFVGKNTIVILGWHFLAFKVVTYFIIKTTNQPIDYMAAFPVLNSYYWLAYVVVGIAIPLAMGWCWDKVLIKIK